MNLTVDRDSGVFDRTTSDQLNIKATQTYEKLINLEVPEKEYKQPTYSDYFSPSLRAPFRVDYSGGLYVTHYYDISNDLVVNSFSIGKAHIISFSCKPKFIETVVGPGWSGNVPAPRLVTQSIVDIGESSQLPNQDVWAFDGNVIANISPVDAKVRVQVISSLVDTIEVFTYFIK